MTSPRTTTRTASAHPKAMLVTAALVGLFVLYITGMLVHESMFGRSAKAEQFRQCVASTPVAQQDRCKSW